MFYLRLCDKLIDIKNPYDVPPQAGGDTLESGNHLSLSAFSKVGSVGMDDMSDAPIKQFTFVLQTVNKKQKKNILLEKTLAWW